MAYLQGFTSTASTYTCSTALNAASSPIDDSTSKRKGSLLYQGYKFQPLSQYFKSRVHTGSPVAGQGKILSYLICYETDLPTGKVCIQRLLLDVSFMGMRDGANGLISARWGVYPPGRMCSMDSALPTWNLPGALESRCWDSSMFSRTSRKHNLKSVWDHAESKQKSELLRDIKTPQSNWEQGELRNRQGDKLKSISIQSASYNTRKNSDEKENFTCHYNITLYCATLY